MPEEKTVTNPEEETQEIDYIAALNELRNNTVPKEQYDKLKGENAQLLKSLINGETIDMPDDPSEPDISELRKDLFNGDASLSNLEYVTKALELRDALIEAGAPDPFLPIGHQIAPTAEDREAAARVAKVMKECVDGAGGDSSLFTSLLMRETVDVKAPQIKQNPRR